MKRLPTPALLTLLALLSVTLAPGEEFTNIPRPTPPFVAAVPARCAWTIAVQNKTLPAPAPGAVPRPDNRVSEVRSTQVDGVRRDIVVLGDTGTSEYWYLPGVRFWTTLQHDVDAAPTATQDPLDPFPSSPRGFPGVQWVNLASYDQPVRFQKIICYHYTAAGDHEAWIDVETRMPVAYKGPDASYQYTFAAPPDGALTPPAPYQAAMDKYRQIMSHITPAN